MYLLLSDFNQTLRMIDDQCEHKSYVCLFTCAVARAIHLELVKDLTVPSFLRAFRSFAARRPLPQKMISDNATTYLSAANELKQLFDSPAVQMYLANKRVEWEFIPKRAPWFGGFWERLIGITKTSLRKVLGRSYVSSDELYTTLTEIEATLNDRPLTYLSVDSNDLPPLTPSHLLHGRSLTTLPNMCADAEELNDPTFGTHNDLLKRHGRLTHIQTHFWKRWCHEYLTVLREQDRITGKGLSANKIRIGDVVLVEDSTLPRLKWRLALVETVHQGNDGLVRSVNIKTSTGRKSRPISKLYPVELNNPVPPANPSASKDSVSERRVQPRRAAADIARTRIRDMAADFNTE